MALALDEYDAPGQQPVECCVHDLSVFEGCEEVESTEVIIGNVGDHCKFSLCHPSLYLSRIQLLPSTPSVTKG